MTAAAAIFVATVPVARAEEPPKNFVIREVSKPVATVTFEDGQGRAGTLADFKGKVVLVNLWATWCVPCRKEMPALDRLQAALGGTDFEVVPISIDRGGVETVRKFYTETGLHNLGMYLDVSGQSLRTLGAIGLPTTLLLARDGSETGRIVGPAEWDEPEIVEFLRNTLSKQNESANASAQSTQRPSVPSEPAGFGSLLRGLQWLRALFAK
jgi:thiol-disulfide isomerase/thioredoxin